MRYTLKIWLTTFIIAPALILAIEYFSDDTHMLDHLSMYPFMLGFGAFFSLPAMALFYVLHYLLIKYTGEIWRKIILSLYTFISVYATFYWWELMGKNGWWFAVYALTMTVALWLYKNDTTAIFDDDANGNSARS